MRFLMVWYDGNDPQVCVVDAPGPFGLDEALLRHLTEIDEAPYEVQINAVIEIPDDQPDTPGEYSHISPPVYHQEEAESYPLHTLRYPLHENGDKDDEPSSIPYYDLRT